MHIICLFSNKAQGTQIIKKLQAEIQGGLKIIEYLVIANTTGKNLSKASGISIYFPERRINPTYQKTNFAQSNQWFRFITTFLAS